MQPKTLNVFVSSTWIDLQPEWKAVEVVLGRFRWMKFVEMRYFGDTPDTAQSSTELELCQLYIGIFSDWYGSGSAEAEYQRANALGLPCFIYFKTANSGNSELKDGQLTEGRFETLKKTLRPHHAIAEFSSPEELVALVTADLSGWLKDNFYLPAITQAGRGGHQMAQRKSLLTELTGISAIGQRSVAVGRDNMGSIFTGDIHIGNKYTQVFFQGEAVRESSEADRPRRHHVTKRTNANTKAAVVKGYLEWVLRQFQNLEIVNSSGHPVRLENVFVTLRAHAGSQYELLRSSELNKHGNPGEYKLPSTFAERDEIKTYIQGGSRAIDLRQLFGQYRTVLILGDPGTGKTTLSRWYAFKNAEALLAPDVNAVYVRENEIDPGSDSVTELRLNSPRLPIYVSQSQFAEWRALALANNEEASLLSYLGHKVSAKYPKGHPASGTLIDKDTLNAVLSEYVEDRKALLLVDGLDEGGDAPTRRDLRHCIDSFVNEWCAPGDISSSPDSDVSSADYNRALITSRIVGYEDAPLTSVHHRFTIEPLSNDAIARYCERWVEFVGGVEPEDRTAGLQQMMDALLGPKGSIASGFASNPLLLSLFVRTYWSDPDHPPRLRAELYARVIAERVKVLQGRMPHAPIVVTLAAISRVAFQLHAERFSGIFTRDDLNQWLLETDLPATAQLQPEKLSKIILEDVGLISARGPQRYAFTHRTFQEYLAARHLVAHIRSRSENLTEYMQDPHWHEVTALALGHVCVTQTEEVYELLVEQLLNPPKNSELNANRAGAYFLLRSLGDLRYVPLLAMQRVAYGLLEDYGSDRSRIDPTFRIKIEALLLKLLNDTDRNRNAREALECAIVNALTSNETTLVWATSSLVQRLAFRTSAIIDALLRALPLDSEESRWITHRTLNEVDLSALALSGEISEDARLRIHQHVAAASEAARGFLGALPKSAIKSSAPLTPSPREERSLRPNFSEFRQLCPQDPEGELLKHPQLLRAIVALHGGFADLSAFDLRLEADRILGETVDRSNGSGVDPAALLDGIILPQLARRGEVPPAFDLDAVFLDDPLSPLLAEAIGSASVRENLTTILSLILTNETLPTSLTQRLRTLGVSESTASLLARRQGEDSQAVRSSAAVALLATAALDPEAQLKYLISQATTPELRIAIRRKVSRALALLYDPLFRTQKVIQRMMKELSNREELWPPVTSAVLSAYNLYLKTIGRAVNFIDVSQQITATEFRNAIYSTGMSFHLYGQSTDPIYNLAVTLDVLGGVWARTPEDLESTLLWANAPRQGHYYGWLPLEAGRMSCDHQGRLFECLLIADAIPRRFDFFKSWTLEGLAPLLSDGDGAALLPLALGITITSLESPSLRNEVFAQLAPEMIALPEAARIDLVVEMADRTADLKARAWALAILTSRFERISPNVKRLASEAFSKIDHSARSQIASRLSQRTDLTYALDASTRFHFLSNSLSYYRSGAASGPTFRARLEALFHWLSRLKPRKRVSADEILQVTQDAVKLYLVDRESSVGLFRRTLKGSFRQIDRAEGGELLARLREITRPYNGLHDVWRQLVDSLQSESLVSTARGSFSRSLLELQKQVNIDNPEWTSSWSVLLLCALFYDFLSNLGGPVEVDPGRHAGNDPISSPAQSGSGAIDEDGVLSREHTAALESVATDSLGQALQAYATRYIGEGTPLDVLTQWANGEQKELRSFSSLLFAEIGHMTPRVVDDLADLLDDPIEMLRMRAMVALHGDGGERQRLRASKIGVAAIDRLAHHLTVRRARGGLRTNTLVWAFERVHHDSKAVLTTFFERLSTDTEIDKTNTAIRQIYSATPEVVEALASYLHDSDERVTSGALRGLASLGGHQPYLCYQKEYAATITALTPRLLELCSDGRVTVRRLAFEALSLIGDCRAIIAGVPDLLGESSMSTSAFIAVGKLFERSAGRQPVTDSTFHQSWKSSHDQMITLLKHTDDRIVAAAAQALITMGSDPDLLAELLQDNRLVFRALVGACDLPTYSQRFLFAVQRAAQFLERRTRATNTHSEDGVPETLFKYAVDHLAERLVNDQDTQDGSAEFRMADLLSVIAATAELMPDTFNETFPKSLTGRLVLVAKHHLYFTARMAAVILLGYLREVDKLTCDAYSTGLTDVGYVQKAAVNITTRPWSLTTEAVDYLLASLESSSPVAAFAACNMLVRAVMSNKLSMAQRQSIREQVIDALKTASSQATARRIVRTLDMGDAGEGGRTRIRSHGRLDLIFRSNLDLLEGRSLAGYSLPRRFKIGGEYFEMDLPVRNKEVSRRYKFWLPQQTAGNVTVLEQQLGAIASKPGGALDSGIVNFVDGLAGIARDEQVRLGDAMKVALSVARSL